MARRFFVCSDGREKGPYSLAQLHEAVRQTAISERVLVRADDAQEARPLAEVLREPRPLRRRHLESGPEYAARVHGTRATADEHEAHSEPAATSMNVLDPGPGDALADLVARLLE